MHQPRRPSSEELQCISPGGHLQRNPSESVLKAIFRGTPVHQSKRQQVAMQPMKSKHRCQCYTQSAAFLYGLRRDAPSTERVLLERLLNILSRAAAHRNKNPQRLWAESERPEWWEQVTDLAWKNPREHPKDNKNTLRKKIEVLEAELKKRKLMTPELEEEVTIHRGSKKVDLELKSDFEAVISKASGLHFMLDKIHSKMGQTRIISDKMASYIGETKRCIDHIHQRISQMHQQVQEREERKSDLWTTMGVSKLQRQANADYLPMDTFSPDSDMEMLDLFLDVAEQLPAKPMPPVSPFSPSSTSNPLSLESSDPSDSGIVQKQHTADPQLVASPGSSVHVSSMESSVQSLRSQRAGSSSCKSLQRSLSQNDSLSPDLKELLVVPLSPSHNASVTLPSQFKRTRVQHADDLLHEQAYMKSRRTQAATADSCHVDVIEIDEEDSDDYVEVTIRSPTSVTLNPGSPRVVLKPRPEMRGKQTMEAASHVKLFVKPASSLPSHFVPLTSLAGCQSPTPTVTQTQPHRHVTSDFDHHVYIRMVTSPTESDDWPLRVEPAIKGRSPGSGQCVTLAVDEDISTELLPDVVEDGGEEVEGDELDNVEEILEVSSTPTVSMYAADTSDMEQLAQMTHAISCEDLTPSVTESVMTGHLPVPQSALQHAQTSVDRPQHASSLSCATVGSHRKPPDTSTEKGQTWTPATTVAGCVESAGGLRQMLQSAGGERQVLQSAGGQRQMLQSAGGERQVLQSPGGLRQALQSAGRKIQVLQYADGGKQLFQFAGGKRQVLQPLPTSTERRQQQSAQRGSSASVAPSTNTDSDEQSLSRAIGGLRDGFLH